MRDGGLITVDRLNELDAMNALDSFDAEALAIGILEISLFIEGLIGHGCEYEEAAAKVALGRGTSYLDLQGINGTNLPLAGQPTALEDPYGWSLISTSALHLVPFVKAGSGVAKTLHRLDGRVWPDKTEITITGNWGWLTVPTDMEIVAARLVRRYFMDDGWRDSMSGQSADTGGLRNLSVSNTSVSVGFGTSQTNLDIQGTGDPIADGILRKYLWRLQVQSI